MRVSKTVIILAIVLACPLAYSATIGVNTTQQPSASNLCTLSDAIKAANNNAAYGACTAGDDKGDGKNAVSGDVIELQANETYLIAPPTAGITGLPAITTEITFNGHGALIKGKGDPATPFRLMAVGGSNIQATFSDISFSYGYNSEYDGGAIAATQPSSVMRFNRCSFRYNVAKFGGAVSGKTVILQDTALYANYATLQGGAIYADNLILLNSTISGNTAGTEGSAVYIPKDGGTATVINSTIFNNVSQGTGAGLAGKGIISLQNSIVAQNASLGSTDKPFASCHTESNGKVVTRNHNIINPVTCTIFDGLGNDVSVTGADRDIFNKDPSLGKLVKNNLPGQIYFPLLDNSIAVDHGSASACATSVKVGVLTFDLSKDQLGRARVGQCDTGAIEAICGDGIIHTKHHEQCEGNNLGGATCASFLGVAQAFGELVCSTTCLLEVGSCSKEPAPLPEPPADIKDEVPPEPLPPSDAVPGSEGGLIPAGPSSVAVPPTAAEEFGKDNPFVGQKPSEEKPSAGAQDLGSLSGEQTGGLTPGAEAAPENASSGGGGCSLVRQ